MQRPWPGSRRFVKGWLRRAREFSSCRVLKFKELRKIRSRKENGRCLFNNSSAGSCLMLLSGVAPDLWRTMHAKLSSRFHNKWISIHEPSQILQSSWLVNFFQSYWRIICDSSAAESWAQVTNCSLCNRITDEKMCMCAEAVKGPLQKQRFNAHLCSKELLSDAEDVVKWPSHLRVITHVIWGGNLSPNASLILLVTVFVICFPKLSNNAKFFGKHENLLGLLSFTIYALWRRKRKEKKERRKEKGNREETAKMERKVSHCDHAALATIWLPFS